MSGRRAVMWAAFSALVIAAVVAALSWSGQHDAIPRSRTPPEDAPGFHLENVYDTRTPVSLAEYRGRPVVLNFWASWCVPCRREMPLLERAHRRAGQAIAFVGVNHLDGRRAASEFLEETGVSYPSGYDPKGKVAPAYGARGLPETYFISPRGQIVDRIIGELNRDELDAAIKASFPRRARDLGRNQAGDTAQPGRAAAW